VFVINEKSGLHTKLMHLVLAKNIYVPK